MNWSEPMIARQLAREIFQRKCVVMVPNCSWTGYECDLLVVTTDLRIIDVEVKISRADLRIDLKKDKWWHWLRWDQRVDGETQRQRRDWPAKVWKHYYAMPAEIWRSELLDKIPATSGVILCKPWRDSALRESKSEFTARVEKRAKPCRDAVRITTADAVDIARLANLRMWDALADLERMARSQNIAVAA
ncbi:MAG: hypothetical protein NUV75_13470 [Gallionella sp.]|nr:hypothetical protein [Gallionella sp.]